MFNAGLGLQQQYQVPNVDEFVDLDNFLDTYLTQLHSDTHRQQQGAAAGPAGAGAPSNSAIPPGQNHAPSMVGSQAGMGMVGMTGIQQPMAAFDATHAQPHMQAPNMSLLTQVPGMSGLTGLGTLGQMPGLGGLPGMHGGFTAQPGLQAFSAAALNNSMAAGMPNGMGAMGMAGLGMHPMQAQAMGPGALQPGTAMAGAGHGGPGLAAPAATTATTNKPGRGRGARGGTSRSSARKSEPDHDSGSDHGGDSSDDRSSDAGEHKSRKKQMTTDEAERRHLALQEKNRRAQRRFRERQKTKLQDLHKQIDELTHKVSLLQNENSALHSRTSILEKVLDMRNEQIQVMQETKEGSGYPSHDDELLQIQDIGGQLVQLTPEMIKELSSDQIYKIYQLYVKELSGQLTSPAAGSPGEGASPEAELHTTPHIDKLVKDLSMMIMRLGVIKPLETRKFIVVSRQYLGNNETEVIQLWKNVMKAIDLNEAQKREVVELKRMFLHKIEPIMEERKHLNVQIQANLPHDTFHTKNALTYIKAHEAVIKLRDNLRAEQHVVLEFAIAVFRGVFRARQMATLLVKCYPAVPDALGIASALAAELGEPDMQVNHQLAMHLGGYLENNPSGSGGGAAGNNFLPLATSSGQQQQQPASSGGGGTPGAVGGTDSGGPGAVAAGAGGAGDPYWLQRPNSGIPGPSTLLAIADQGPAALGQVSGSPNMHSHSQSGVPC